MLLHKIILVLLISSGTKQLSSQPAALSSIICIIIRARTAFLSLVYSIDRFFFLRQIFPNGLGSFEAIVGKILIIIRIDTTSHSHSCTCHSSAGSTGTINIPLLCICIRGFVKTWPLCTRYFVEGTAILALHLLQELQLKFYFAKSIWHGFFLYSLREEQLSLKEFRWGCLISQHHFTCCKCCRGSVFTIITSIIPAARYIYHITFFVQLICKIYLSFLILSMAAGNFQASYLILHRRISAGQGIGTPILQSCYTVNIIANCKISRFLVAYYQLVPAWLVKIRKVRLGYFIT